MKHKWIIIALSVIFFLTALTFYVNRVIFPTVVRKIAIEQAEKFLKRKVEIESLHFNWLSGVVINHVKIYQKGSSQEILAQAETISVGIIFVPGLKQHKLILPFVNVQSPSLYLIHHSDDTWNFSDLLTAPVADPKEKPAPVSVTVGSINLINGKVRLDDVRSSGLWTENIDQVNLKVGLSLEGISFDGSLSLPQKQGYISAHGAYQPLNQSLKSSVIIRNIKPLDYMSLVPIKFPFTLTSAAIRDVKAEVDYSPEKIKVQGNWSIKNLDISQNDQHIKTDMDVSDAIIAFNKNLTSVKGNFSLAATKLTLPTLSLEGNFKANVDEFVMHSPENISLKATLSADSVKGHLADNQSFEGQLNAKIRNALLQKDTAQFDGDFSLAQAFVILNDKQSLKGNLVFNNIQIQKDKDTTTANADLDLNHVDFRMPGQHFTGNLTAHHATVSLDHQNNIKINAALDLDSLMVETDKTNVKASLHLKSFKAFFDQTQQSLDAQIQGLLQDAVVKLEQGQLTATANLDFHTVIPLKKPTNLQYSGTLSMSDAKFEGLSFGPIEHINLTTDFKTDLADIQNLSLSVLDTTIKASGKVTDFSKPLLNVTVASDRFDLSKIKTVAPELLKTYGLTVDGEASFNVKFKGLANDYLNGQFNALATLNKVNVQSVSAGSFKNISGTLKAEGNTLSWDNFTATIMDHELTSSGSFTDFKNPKIKAVGLWNGLDLKAQINKTDNLVNIESVTGTYLTASFNTNGSLNVATKDPIINLHTDVKFKLEDLSTLLPTLKATLEPLKISGAVTATSSIKGPLSNWKTWESTATIQSDLVSIAGFKFNTVNLDVAEADQKVSKFNLTSKFYEGDLNIVTTADLTDPAISFETALHVENVNLAKLKNDTGAKDEDLRGFIALTSVVKGTIQNILGLTGKGALNISQGYLMKKEFSSLFMIPELSNLTFTDATANFEIANQIVSTDNFALKSEGAILNGKGTIGFDHKIQMEMHPEFNADAIAQSDSMRKGPSALIASAAGTYLTFTVTGTLDKPVIRTIKKPTELIKKTGEILKNNVGEILQGFFQ